MGAAVEHEMRGLSLFKSTWALPLEKALPIEAARADSSGNKSGTAPDGPGWGGTGRWSPGRTRSNLFAAQREREVPRWHASPCIACSASGRFCNLYRGKIAAR